MGEDRRPLAEGVTRAERLAASAALEDRTNRSENEELMQATSVFRTVVLAAVVAGGSVSGDASAQDPAPAVDAAPRLRVRVVDDGGRPLAGIPVEWRPIRNGRVVRGVATVRAAADGIAEFGEVTAIEGRSGGSLLGIVALEVLARDPPQMLVDLSALRGEDVVIALPRGDLLGLRVLDAMGHPVALDGKGRAFGEVEVFGVFGGDETRLREQSPVRVNQPISVSAGRGEIAFVESGLEVEVLLKLDDGSIVSSRYEFVPRESSPIAEVRLPPPGPRIEGCFVLAPGSPIDLTRIDARIELISGHSGIEKKVTPKVAADGRFVIETGGCVDEFNDLHVRFLDSGGSVIGLWHYAYRQGDAVILLVGDVAIPNPIPIVSGRVVDDAGTPVAGAELRVSLDAAVRAALALSDRWPPDAVDHDDAARWFEAKSAADGSFVASLPFEVACCTILASADGHQRGRTAAVVKRGAADITLVLPRFGTVAGRLLLPGATNTDWFTARLSMTESIDAEGNENPVDWETITNDEFRGDVGRDGTLTFHNVEPGVHTLWLSFRSSGGEETRRVQRIVVKPGAETTVAPIDLRSTRFPRAMIVLPVVATGGASRPLVKNWKLVSIRSDGRRGATFDPDSSPDFQGGGAPQVDVVAPGLRSKRVPCADGFQVVELAPGAPLVIHVVPPPSPGSARVVVVPIAATGDVVFEEAVHAEIDAQGTARLRVGAPGACDVLLFERPSPESSTVEWNLVAAQRKAITVADSVAPQEFTIEWKSK
jgi:hypothetical protein